MGRTVAGSVFDIFGGLLGGGGGRRAPINDDMWGQDSELAMTTALGNYHKLQLQTRAAEQGGNFLLDKLFPSESAARADLLMRLEITKKKRELGLPDDTEEYEDLLNKPTTLLDPGRAIALGSVAATTKQPLLKLGASPFLKGFQHGPAGRALGAVGRIFR
jgi:hypothetical protein